MPEAEALAIPNWFDPETGYEPANHARPYAGPLSWYKARVHTGETVRRLTEKHGFSATVSAVFLFDRLAQLAAAQKRERRGLILDQFGRPHTPKTLSQLLAVREKWIIRTLAVLLDAGWIARAPAKKPLYDSASPDDGAQPARRPAHNLCAMETEGDFQDDAQAARRRAATTTRKILRIEGEGGTGEGAGLAPAAVATTPHASSDAGPEADAARILARAGFSPIDAKAITKALGVSPARAAEAAEAAAALEWAHQLRGTGPGYIRAYLEHGYTPPAAVERYRARHNGHTPTEAATT